MDETDGTRRPYHHGDLRSSLIEAGIAELRDHGLEGFTLRSCARRAGVSHGAPAHHFADTNALLTAMAALGFRRFLAAQAERKAAAEATPQAQLRAAGMGYIDFAMADPDLFHLVFTSRRTDHSDRELAKAAEAAFVQLSNDVGAVLGSDPLRSEAGLLSVSAVWAGVHGIAELMINGRLPLAHLEPTERGRLVGALLDRIVALVG